MKKSEDGCLLAVGALALIPVVVAVRGWCVSWLWLWFVTTTFAVRPITTWEAVGLATLVSAIVPQSSNKSDDSSLATLFVAALIAPFLVLGFGWMIFHWGMGK